MSEDRASQQLPHHLLIRIQELGLAAGSLPYGSEQQRQAEEEFDSLVETHLSEREQTALRSACSRADPREIIEHSLRALGLPKPQWPSKQQPYAHQLPQTRP